jgi:hypothetical protein
MLHVGAHADRFSAVALLQRGDHPGAPQAAVDSVAPGLELFGDEVAGRDFLIGQFGLRVDAVPKCQHFGQAFGNFRQDCGIHWVVLRGKGWVMRNRNSSDSFAPSQLSSALSRVSGSAIIASTVITLVPATYQAGAAGFPVAWMSQVMMNCVVPPNSETPMA